MPEPSLTHFDADGASQMVDVSEKSITTRQATASAVVTMLAETLSLIREKGHKKGDVLEVARLAGIMATKRTGDLIPLCHPLPIESAEIKFSFPSKTSIKVTTQVTVTGKTGVEMEAMTAASISALTIYDMCKAVDRGIVIESVRLEEKRGGRSGHWKCTS